MLAVDDGRELLSGGQEEFAEPGGFLGLSVVSDDVSEKVAEGGGDLVVEFEDIVELVMEGVEDLDDEVDDGMEFVYFSERPLMVS